MNSWYLIPGSRLLGIKRRPTSINLIVDIVTGWWRREWVFLWWMRRHRGRSITTRRRRQLPVIKSKQKKIRNLYSITDERWYNHMNEHLETLINYIYLVEALLKVLFSHCLTIQGYSRPYNICVGGRNINDCFEKLSYILLERFHVMLVTVSCCGWQQSPGRLWVKLSRPNVVNAS